MKTRHSRRSNFLMGAVLAAGAIAAVPCAQAESLSWNGWTLDYQVSGDFDGLSLTNVMYQNHQIIRKISLPVMRVFYDNNACGPNADRLGGTLSPIPRANNATIAQREFTLAGRTWYELVGAREIDRQSWPVAAMAITMKEKPNRMVTGHPPGRVKPL